MDKNKNYAYIQIFGFENIIITTLHPDIIALAIKIN